METEIKEKKESQKDLIVDVSSTEVRIALLENHRLSELNKESSTGRKFTIGDCYLGKVKKVMPALNAAFVDIGDEKEAFVHYLDLGLYFDAFDEFVRKTNPSSNPSEVYSGIKLGHICGHYVAQVILVLIKILAKNCSHFRFPFIIKKKP